jgi:hypothetical protein
LAPETVGLNVWRREKFLAPTGIRTPYLPGHSLTHYNDYATLAPRYVREKRYSSTIFDFGTRRKRGVSFKPRPIYLGVKLDTQRIRDWTSCTAGLENLE